VTEDAKNPADLLCDVLLYAPLGFAFEARRLMPELAQRGRNQVATARVIGEFVVQRAGSQLGPDVEKLGRDVGRAVEGLLAGFGLSIPPLFPVDPSGGAPGDGAAATATAPEGADATVATNGAAAPEDTGAVPSAAQLAIADYDSLAASQVVPRLASLDVDELAAVKAYESAKRGRRTILNRVDQLLEQRGPSGA
jgi:hypothetical protein